MLKKQMNAMQWIKDKNGFHITTTHPCDWIVSPQDGTQCANAPFLYTEIEGDFMLSAKVQHDFLGTYDAVGLFAYQDDTHWAKACFEASDFHTHTVVSVMTNSISDDANGIDTDSTSVWLQLCRKQQTFAVHYSHDGIHYHMVRICSLPFSKVLRVGLIAQSPLAACHTFFVSEIRLQKKAVDDIRKGM